MSNKIYYYQNFDIDVNNGSLDILLWSIYAGVILGVLASLLYRVYTSSFFRALISAGALDENHAVTIDSLDFRGKWYFKRQINAGSSLSRLLVCSNENSLRMKPCGSLKRFWHESFLGSEAPAFFPFDTAKFYLPEERRITAELRFTEEKSPVRTFLFCAVLLAVVIAAVTVFLPELLQMLDNLLTQLTPQSKFV